MGANPTCRALLIGIDDYPPCHKPLNSCSRDVRGISKCLEMSALSATYVTLLVASRENDPPSPEGHREDRPSYDNVRSSLRKIIDEAEAGDIVYIHYSGHGTRRPSIRNPLSNQKAGDLAWVVLGNKGGDVRYLDGSYLAQKIKEMTAKGLRVTLVLDCCFSGSVLRDDEAADEAIRFLEYDPEIDAMYPPEVGEDDKVNIESIDQRAHRDASMLENWMVNPEGFSIIAACEPNGKAYHYTLDSGHAYGCLSYFLIDTLQESDLGGFRGQFEDIFECLRAKFLQHNKMQTPMWYGNRQRGFLEASSISEFIWRSYGLTYPVIKQSDGRLRLEGGRAHGICRGDKFDICKLQETAEVTRVRGLTSDLKVSTPCSLDISTRKALSAIARTTLSLHQYPVLLNPGLSVMSDEVREQIRNKRTSLRIAFDEKELDIRPFFQVNRLSTPGTARYEIMNASCEVFKHVNAELTDLDQTLDTLEHLAKFHLFRDLSRDPSTLGCNVRLFNRRSSETFYPGREAKVTHRDPITIIVDKPNSDLLYVHLYDLRPGWDIANIWKGSYDILYPDSDSEDERDEKLYKMRMLIPDELVDQGQRESVSLIKVLITRKPTSFEPLSLPKIGGSLDHKASNIREDEDDEHESNSEDWAALNFQIRICMDNAEEIVADASH